MRLSKTILLFMLVASLIPTAMVGWLSLSDVRKVLARDAHELAKERVSRLQLKTASAPQPFVRALEALTRTPEFLQLSAGEQLLEMRGVLRQEPEVRAVGFFSRTGTPVGNLRVSSPEVSQPNLETFLSRASSLIPSSRAPSYSEVYWTGTDDTPLMTISLRWDKAERGYLAAEVSLRRLARLVAEGAAGPNALAYVVDRRGRVIAETSVRGQSRRGRDLSSTPVVAEFIRSSQDLSLTDQPKVGDFVGLVAAYAIVPNLGWGVMWEQPAATAYQEIGALERRTVLVAGAALLVAILLAAFISRKVTRPLKSFTQAALQIAQGHFGVRVTVKGKNEIADLAENFNYMSTALQAYVQETKGLYDSVEKGYLETIVALAAAIDSKDTYTRGHSQRVGDLCVEIGRELGFTERQLRQLQYGGLLHDVGKIGISEALLRKGTRLTDEEMAVMRSHPTLGEAIIEPVGFLVPVRAASRNHHERWDGNGYPDKLKGTQIPLIARIVSCADTFDACTSTRPYSKALPLAKAMEIMQSLAGNQLDPEVVEALRRVVSRRGVRLEGHSEPVKMTA